jgi:hypothetical protein
MGELVSPPIIAFGGGSCYPSGLPDSVERPGIIDIRTASGAAGPRHRFANEPGGSLQSVASDRRLELAGRGEKLT